MHNILIMQTTQVFWRRVHTHYKYYARAIPGKFSLITFSVRELRGISRPKREIPALHSFTNGRLLMAL